MDFLERVLPRRLSSRVWLISLPSALVSFEKQQKMPKLPIGRARFWPGAKPRRNISDFTHYEFYEPKKMRDESWIKAWPKG